jgi:hypothetical protein
MVTQYAQMILIRNGKTEALERTPLSTSASAGGYSEDWLQELMFNNPAALPVNELNPAYGPLIPLCREFSTSAGPIDILYISPNGSLTVVECKLWRNPEARRKVVGQIIDYAKELAAMDYTDFEKVWRERTGNRGASIYQSLKTSYGEMPIDEAVFIDTVQRNLKSGSFLLMVLGDGIRRDVEAMSDFMNSYSGLNFTFALVEAAIYQMEGDLLVQPRVIARTTTVKRHVISLVNGQMQMDSKPQEEEHDAIIAPDPVDQARLQFWSAFLEQLKLDDAVQPLTKPSTKNNLWFTVPDTHGDIWFTVYRSFSANPNQIGVFYTCAKNSQLGRAVYENLLEEKIQIEQEFGGALKWDIDGAGRCSISLDKYYPGTDLNKVPVAEQMAWLSEMLNRFVNVLRHRVERYVRDIESAA